MLILIFFSCFFFAKNITCHFNWETQIITFVGEFMQIIRNNVCGMWIWYSGLKHSLYKSHSLRIFPSAYWTNPGTNATLISDLNTNHTSLKISLPINLTLRIIKTIRLKFITIPYIIFNKSIKYRAYNFPYDEFSAALS